MIITIDTHKDGKEEIQKAIKLLYSLISEQVHTNANLFENNASSVDANAAAFGSFFDNAAKQDMIEQPAARKIIRKVELY